MRTLTLNKKITMIFVILLIIALPILGSMADGTSETKATVSFIAGGLSWGNLTNDNMYLNFDEHTLPTAAVAYSSINAPHSITIDDARDGTDLDGWNVQVEMSAFTGGTTPFEGIVTLTGGEVSHAGGADTTDIDVEQTIVIASEGAAMQVVSAPDETVRGQYEIKWAANDQAKLSISASEARNVEIATYEATLTWTLSAGPAL